MDTEIRAQKVDTGEENSPTAPAGTQTHDLSIMSLALEPLSSPNPCMMYTNKVSGTIETTSSRQI